MLYSKRRKNLGGGRRKRSNRRSYGSKRLRMIGGTSGQQAGFTGHSMEYEPCPIKESPPNFDSHEEYMKWYIPLKNIQKECRKTAIRWDDLSKEAKEAEIEKQWGKLTEGQKMLFIRAGSDAERQYLLYRRKYLMGADALKRWENYTPDQKQLFISTVDNNTQTQSQEREHDFLSNNIANEILENPSIWFAMTPEQKKTYMEQHQYVGHRFNFQKGDYDEDWFKTLTSTQQETLNSFVKKNEIGFIQFFSSPIGEMYLDNPNSYSVKSLMSGH